MLEGEAARGAHDATAYGKHLAEHYDDLYEGVLDTVGATDKLRALAGAGPVLEFGIGTGRIALPLAAHGLGVAGIDGSAEMLDILRSKPDGSKVHLTQGNFCDTAVPGEFALCFLIFNTIYALPDQQSQVRCFANAAAHLHPGGRFVVEAWVPDPPKSGDNNVRSRRLARGLAGLVIQEHDPVLQILATTQIVVSESGPVRTFPVVHRYAWPSELDLMATLAGFSLEHRWSDWHGSPFNAQSMEHVSVWRLDDRVP
jgi:SAM-dependent methyltransferase